MMMLDMTEHTTQLAAANKELESFSNSISSELRVPLRAIGGYSRILLSKYGDELSSDAKRLLENIRNNTESMGVLFDEVLSYARLQVIGMETSKIDMGKLAQKIWTEIRGVNQERELEFRLTKILPAYGNEALIRQVLFNLISNAIKFTKDRKPGIIEMSSYREPKEIVYCLKDNGVGFDMAYYDNIFGLFKRLHSPEQYQGAGAGLAVIQRIIKRHGGRGWAKGEVGKGATFYFTLPEK